MHFGTAENRVVLALLRISCSGYRDKFASLNLRYQDPECLNDEAKMLSPLRLILLASAAVEMMELKYVEDQSSQLRCDHGARHEVVFFSSRDE